VAAKIGSRSTPGKNNRIICSGSFFDIIDKKLHKVSITPDCIGYNLNGISDSNHSVVYRVGDPYDQVRVVRFDMNDDGIVVVE